MYSKYVLNEDELYTFYVCLFSLNLPFTNVFPKLSAIIIWQSFSAVDNTTIGGPHLSSLFASLVTVWM